MNLFRPLTGTLHIIQIIHQWCSIRHWVWGDLGGDQDGEYQRGAMMTHVQNMLAEMETTSEDGSVVCGTCLQ